MEKKRMNQNLFIAIKTLLAAGSTHPEISSYLGISKSTVGRVSSSETIEEYFNQVAAMNAKIREKKQAKKVTEQPVNEPEQPKKGVSSYYMDNRMLDALKEQNELLKSISAKLAFIVEQLA